VSKVYIVTSGEYSDYGINAVFLDEAEALAYVKQPKWQSVEIWETGAEGKMVRGDGRVRWRVEMTRKSHGRATEDNPMDSYGPVEGPIYNMHRSHDGNYTLIGHVYATDKKHALKIVNEMRGILVAKGLWGKVARKGLTRVQVHP